MSKQLVFSEDARRKLKRGIDTVATAVSTTLGPKGSQCRHRQEVRRADHHPRRRDRRQGN